MSIGALGSALSGLRIAQQSIDVVSNNIANVSTEGYSRKRQEQSTLVLTTGDVLGVRAEQITRNVDRVLQRDLFEQTSVKAQLETRSRFLQLVQDFHGPPDGEVALSSKLGDLYENFSELANNPDSPFLIDRTYTQAELFAGSINEFSEKLTEIRNDIQDEMRASIDLVESYLGQISDLNQTIRSATRTGRTVADLEDQRDLLVKKLSEEVAVNYYVTGENSMVIQTGDGTLLTESTAVDFFFQPIPLGPGSYYPASAAGVLLNDPVIGTDITAEPRLGGRLGELIKLRDETLPQYQAQLDELALRTAQRFDAVGLRLFTDSSGEIPSDTPPNYVGFSANFQVNPEVTADRTLLRSGTSGNTVLSGSNEVLRKVVEFAFGLYEGEYSLGDTDIRDDTINPDDLYTILGISAQARSVGDTNIGALSTLDISQYLNPGSNDTFSITVGANPAVDITIGAGDTAADLVNTINTELNTALGITGFASLGNGGQLIFDHSEGYTITDVNLGTNGLETLGIDTGTVSAIDPSFSIQLGQKDPVTIAITATDTDAELLAKINAIDGITASTDANGYLRIEPDEGGDINLLNVDGFPLQALGMQEGLIEHTAYATTGLGPGTNINAEISTATTLKSYSELMISNQSEDAFIADQNFETEQAYFQELDTRNGNFSAVNLDEEMANLIRLQTAYNAAARAISVVEDLFNELTDVLLR